MKRRIYALAGIVAILALASACATGPRSAQPDAPSAVSANAGGFSARLLPTDRPDETRHGWETQSAVSNIPSSARIPLGRLASFAVLFSGCAPDNNGKCSLYISLNVYRPDGTLYASVHDILLYKAPLNPGPSGMTFALSSMKLRLEQDDPPGPYRIDAGLYDYNSQKPLALSAGFEAYASDEAPDTSALLQHYYESPRPARVLPLLGLLASQRPELKSGDNLGLLGFLAVFFRDNPAPMESALGSLGSYPPDYQRIIKLAAWLSGDEGAESVKRMFPDYAAGTPKRIEDLPVTEPPHLDLLWGAFMASGDERYLSGIISTLRGFQAKDDNRKTILAGAAMWSLSANAVKLPRVYEIIVRRAKTDPEEIAAPLRKIIASTNRKLIRPNGSQ